MKPRAAIAAAVLLCLPVWASPADSGKTVLVLHSYHHGFTWTDKISEGITRAFSQATHDVELIHEFLDSRRLATPEYFEAVQTLLRQKYREKSIDVAICSDDHALNFMLTLGKDVFPDVPVVFCSVSGYRESMRKGRELTGLIDSIEISGTIDIALKLHPETRHLAVILDTSRTGRALKRKVEKTLEPYAARLQVRYLEDLTVEELREPVGALPPDSILLPLIFKPEEHARVLSHEQNLERLRPFCRVPIYAVWDFYLGHGIVGGQLTSGVDEGEKAGRLAYRILRGEKASEIPLGRSPVRYKFDYDQLDRFGIDPDRLPDDSVILNMPHSVYDHYRGVIHILATVIAALSLTVISLLVAFHKRQQAETQSARLASAVNQAAESIVITDAKGVVQYVNPWFEKMTGYKSSEIIGKTPGILSSGRHDEHFYKAMWDTLRANRIWKGYFVNKKKDGTIFEEEAVISPVSDRTGRIVNYVAVKRDVTHERMLENQVRQSQKMAAIGQIAHRITHRFTNMLVVIMGNTQLVRSKISDRPHLTSILDGVTNAANDVASFSAELLAFAHPSPLKTRRMPLHKAILGIEQVLRKSISGDCEFGIDADKEAGKVEVDQSQIEQALLHLVINSADAVDHTGSIKVKVAPADLPPRDLLALQAGMPEDRRHQGEFAMIAVIDDGRGMTEEQKARMFEPFFSTKEDDPQAGLGLATVYRIVAQHRGHILVDSQPDKGTTVRILLPLLD